MLNQDGLATLPPPPEADGVAGGTANGAGTWEGAAAAGAGTTSAGFTPGAVNAAVIIALLCCGAALVAADVIALARVGAAVTAAVVIAAA